MLFQTRTGLSSALEGLGRPEEALPISEGALAQLEEFVGPSHPAAPLADLTPRQIVAELDKYIVGQGRAKRAVAMTAELSSSVKMSVA